MARKKKTDEATTELTTADIQHIARIAYTAQREADLIDQIANQANDFEVRTWEFALPRDRAKAVLLVEHYIKGGEVDPLFYKGGKVFETVAKALL